jgi:hypothetical protein
MGNINIQSLFADIISTPEQREEKLLKEGMLQGQLIASGLKGRVANLAPLAQIAGQLGVQRQENLKREVQPMLGIDPRTTGERLEEAVSGLDMSTPEGLREAALAIQSVDPLRAATLRQAAVEMSQANEDRKRTVELQQLQLEEARRLDADRKKQVEDRDANALQYIAMGVPQAFVSDYRKGALSAKDLITVWGEKLSAGIAARNAFKFTSFKGSDRKDAELLIAESDEAQDLLNMREEQMQIFGIKMPWSGNKVYTERDILDEAAVWKGLQPSLSPREATNLAIKNLPLGGTKSIIGNVNPSYASVIQQGYNVAQPGGNPVVNPSALSGQSTQPEFNASQLSTIDSLVEEAGQLQAQTENSQANIPAEVSQSNETVMQQLLRGVLPQYGAVRNTIEGLDSQVSSGLENEARQAQNYFNTLDEELGASPTSGGASASDYLEAIKTLNFPGIDFATEQVPAMTKNIAGIFKSLIDTLSSVENIKKVTNEGIDVTLYGTGKLIESLVNGQSVGEKEINQVKENIKKLKSSLGKISAPDRKIVNEQIKKLEEFVLTNAGNLAGAFLD